MGKLPVSRVDDDGAAGPRERAIRFKPAEIQVVAEGPVVGERGKATLPRAPKRDKQPAKKPVVVKRPAVAITPDSAASAPSREPPHDASAPATGDDKKEVKSLSRSEDESKRLFMAAGIGARQGVARVSWSDQLVFRCPVCEQQLQCSDDFIGKLFECDTCHAELRIPVPESGEKIELIRSGSPRPDGALMPLVDLPGERGNDGPAGKPTYQTKDELMPADDEGLYEWGLEKADVLDDVPRRSRGWLWIAALLLLPLTGFLVFQTYSSAGRSVGQSAEADGPNPGQGTNGMDWDAIPPITRFVMADSAIRAFLHATDLEAKAKVTRHGPEIVTRMTEYYQRNGGYQPETHKFGNILGVALGDQRMIGGTMVQMVKVNFAKGNAGVYALVGGARGYEVDWEYAVGFGDMSFGELCEAKPAQAVMMRVYLEEDVFFDKGFDRSKFRQFNMTDTENVRVASVFVERGTAVEAAIREAYREEVVRALIQDGSRGNKKLDFTIRLHYEIDGDRRGFVIDEVLSRGWILPEPKS